MEYYGMFNWTNDVPSGSKEIFLSVLEHLRSIENPKILEVGTFTGTSIMTMQNLFPTAECYAVDNWKLDNTELESIRKLLNNQLEMNNVRSAFFKNTKGLVHLIEKDSSQALVEMVEQKKVI